MAGWLFVLLALGVFHLPAVCEGYGLTPIERKAIRQLVDGGDADFSDPSRVVSDQFIEKLLSGGFKKLDADHNMEVHGITIKNAVFQEPITLNFDIPYRVTFDHCEFQKGIDFSGSQFNKDLVFDSSTFGLPASASKGATPETSDVALEFIGATVKGSISFRSSTFWVPVDFTKAHVKELHIDDASFSSADTSDPDLDLTEARVDSDFSASAKGEQPREVVAQFFSVGGSASFGNGNSAFFGLKNFDLTYSHFQNLDIHGFDQWRAKQEATPDNCVVSLDGFSFQEIYIPGKDTSAWRMLDLLDSPQFCYSTQPYLMLEQSLTASGDIGRANDAYIRMRNREREHRVLNPRSPVNTWVGRFGDEVLNVLVGYGREPWHAGVFAIGFTLLGMLIFRPGKMVEQKSEPDSSNHDADGSKPGANKTEAKNEPKKHYSSFWYSLDVLAPAIELGADKAWQPNPEWWFGRTYSYVHRIAGWILLPLILAALTGIVH